MASTVRHWGGGDESEHTFELVQNLNPYMWIHNVRLQKYMQVTVSTSDIPGPT